MERVLSKNIETGSPVFHPHSLRSSSHEVLFTQGYKSQKIGQYVLFLLFPAKRNPENDELGFGHGNNGLANMLATINLLAFALHAVLDSVEGLWKQCRESYQTRRDFFEQLRAVTTMFCFPDWRSLWKSMLVHHPPPLQPAVART